MNAQLGTFKSPEVQNEPMKSYAPGSSERAALQEALLEMQQQAPFEVPLIINGKPVKSSNTSRQPMPHDHAKSICTFSEATPEHIAQAIDGALAAKAEWESMPWADRAAIFLKAAELVSGKWRYKLMAATMLGQGKNAWQAEIDAAAELADFLRFGVKYVEELYQQQPIKNTPGSWNRVEYRALEGFVLAISPFNFTAIGGNLPGAPALVGNTILWKPSPSAIYANYITHQIFTEAGVPPGVIQFVPGPAPEVVAQVLQHRMFAALHFTGSTAVFRSLWKAVGDGVGEGRYCGYPRVVGETGGKNFHVVHESVVTEDVSGSALTNAVLQTVRGAFEYQGQKCSALSRLYVSRKVWEGGFKERLVQETANLKVGPPTEWDAFSGPVIHKASFEKITGYIQKAKDAGAEVLVGGSGDASVGYFVQPTVLFTKDPQSVTMVEEIFGPVLTVYVFEDKDYEKTLDLIDSSSGYGLTGAIFSTSRAALLTASSKLRNAAGNVYFNDKCTGAVVGQQPFGGGRASGTNDKAGSMALFYRFVSARSVKENFVGLEAVGYPSNLL